MPMYRLTGRIWAITMPAVLLVAALAGPAIGKDGLNQTATATQWVPIDFSIDNPSYSGNPFDLVATATFVHSASGETRTTEMFYAGGTTWKIRFTGTRPGIWTATSSSSDPDLNGLSGTVTVEPAAANANGFITHLGNRWARQKGPAGTPQAIVPQFVMYPDPDYYYNRPDRVDSDIQTYLVQHGFNGMHTRVYCRWFDLNKPTHDMFSDMNPNPDFRTFEALELLIGKVHAAGGTVHIWAWGDDGRKQTPTKWGINGTVDRRLQRYIAARLGPLPNWTMGYGYDLPEWVNTEQLCSWHSYMHQHFGWPHGLGGRGPTNQYTQICETLDYSSYEQLKPSYADYVQAIETRPHKPSFSEDRFRVFSTQPSSDPRDYTEEETRRGLYHSTMAGGVANIWGYLVGSSGNWSAPYPNPQWSRTYADFFRDRFRLDMVRDNAITNGLCLRTPDFKRFLFYFENKNSCSVDLSSMPSAVPAVVVDAKLPYSEISVGLVSPGQYTWTAPYTSDWAVAVGHFGDDEPPSVPTGVAALAQSETSVLVTWTASTDNVGVTGYKVFRNGSQVGTSTTTSFTDTGLSAGATYSYSVSAYDDSGNESAQSSPPATVTTPDNTPPSVPTGVSAAAQSETSIVVTWTASTDNVGVAGYKVFRNGSQVGTSTTTSFTDTGLSPNTTYSYRVSAQDASGNNSAESSPPATVTTPDNTPPSVPTNVTATTLSSSSIKVTWTASTDNHAVAGYKVFRNGSQVGAVATTSYTDTSLSPGTTYSYRVSAHDAAGNNSAQSSPPAVASTSDIGIPSVPTDVNAAAQTPRTVKVTWTASTDDVGVVGYKIFRNGSQVGTVATTIFVDAGLSPGTTYSYRVSAHDAAGNNSAQSSPPATAVTMAAVSIAEARLLPDASTVGLTDKVITAVLDDCLYIAEADTRNGIRLVGIESLSGYLVGMTVDVGGTMRTGVEGERYVQGWASVP